MARQPTRPKAKKPAAPKRYCRECAHSYDWHNRSFNDGHLILCRCPLDKKTQHGKYCKFLSDPECDQFKPRPSTTTDYAEAH